MATTPIADKLNTDPRLLVPTLLAFGRRYMEARRHAIKDHNRQHEYRMALKVRILCDTISKLEEASDAEPPPWWRPSDLEQAFQ